MSNSAITNTVVTQAIDQDLQDIANLTPSNGDVLYYNSGWNRLAKGTDDQVLTLASGLPSWADAGGGGGISIDHLTTDFTFNSTTPSSVIGFSMESGSVYWFEGIFYLNTNSSPDTRYYIDAPSGSTGRFGVEDSDTGNGKSSVIDGTSSIFMPTSTTTLVHSVSGVIESGGVGNFNIQIANNSFSTLQTIYKYSYIKYKKLQ